MSEKRRDSKGRVLLSGERQRSDGMYEYRFFDKDGNKQSIYSWKLVSTDKVPQGKRCKEPLRDMERKISRDLEDGVDPLSARKTTLNDFYDDYIAMRYELKDSTRTNYKYFYTKYVRGKFGNRKIADIKYSDIKRFYVHLIQDLGFKPNSLDNIHTVLHPVFAAAVRDGVIRVNPTDGVMAEIKKTHNFETPKRKALTVPQQEAFVNYCATNSMFSHWLPLFTVLLGTGCRVGEAIGLRWDDCDFENGIININHNLVYHMRENGRCEYHVTTPKTQAGTRIIPMLNEVRRSLLDEYDRQKQEGFCLAEVDGYSGFIFFNRFGNVLNPQSINKAIQRISKAYNDEEVDNAKSERREPILIPHFSVHNLRHTFCTRFCENETNIKIIQEIMGHSDIETTMNIYNEATTEKKVESFASLEGKIKIS